MLTRRTESKCRQILTLSALQYIEIQKTSRGFHTPVINHDACVCRFPYQFLMLVILPQNHSADSLESREAVSFPDFPPDFRHSSGLLHSHHDDSQLPCEHHNSLKDVCPDDSLQTTLSGTVKTRGN